MDYANLAKSSYSNNIEATNIVIEDVLLIETRKEGYHNQIRRPFQLTVEPNRLDNLLNKIYPYSGSGMVNISNIDVQKACGNMLTFNQVNMQAANIPNGWQQERFIFLITARYTIGAMNIKVYLQGYTNYNGISYNSTLDPNMDMYINTVASCYENIDPVTGYLHVSSPEIYNILRSHTGEVYLQNMDTGKTLRPGDIINNLFLLEASSNNGMDVHYMDSINQEEGVAANKSNYNPINYITNTINSLVYADQQTSFSNINNGVILRAASGVLDDDHMYRNGLIRALCAISNDNVDVGKFKLGIISKFYNRVPTVIRNNNIYDTNEFSILTTTNTENGMSISPEAIKSYGAAIILSSLISNKLITKLAFSISNITGTPIITILNINTYIPNIDLPLTAERLKQDILISLVPELTDNGLSIVEMFVDIDLVGDINISINLNNNGLIVYRYPIFADGVISPMVGDSNSKINLTNSFGILTDTILNAEPNTIQHERNILWN